MAQFLKISERQVRDAVTILRQCGLVHIHLRYEESASGMKGTRVHIELIIPQIQGISSRPEGQHPDDLSNPIPGQVTRYGWDAPLSPFNARKNQPPLLTEKRE